MTSALSLKADQSTTYTKTETDSAIATAIGISDSRTIGQISTYNANDMNVLINNYQIKGLTDGTISTDAINLG